MRVSLLVTTRTSWSNIYYAEFLRKQLKVFSDYLFPHKLHHRCLTGFLIRLWNFTLHEKFPYSEFFWSVFAVSLRIQSECGKMWTRNTPNTDTFHAVSNKIPLVISVNNSKTPNSLEAFILLRLCVLFS